MNEAEGITIINKRRRREMKRHTRIVLSVIVLCVFVFMSAGFALAAKKPIRIGVMATLTGAFATLGEESVDGVKLALEEVNNEIAGRPVKLFIEDTDATPDTAITKARALVNRDKVSIIQGPLSGAEGIALKKNADEWPNTTIVVSASAAQDVCMRGVKPNVFRPSFMGGQPMYPFGEWAYEKGYRKIVTVGEDYDFPYAQVGGFMQTFCGAGGRVVKKYWVPIGTGDYSSIIADLPKDIDAVFLTLSGSDVVSFLTQLDKFGLMGKVDILGGTTAIDAGTLTTMGEVIDGIVSASIWTGEIDRPQFKQLYDRYFALRKRPPSLFTGMYYRSTKFTIAALQKINGRAEDQKAFRNALQDVSFEDPVSFVSLDTYHQAVMDVFINQVRNIDGVWRNVIIKTYPQVGQFWTYDPEKYQAEPSYSRDWPKCP
jgi:branched-chain amino acid transport system substrate-binding protein